MFKVRMIRGFTLVELMVVVGIVGILSVVAIPNFRKYQAKTKTTEAKVQLSAIYIAEQSFYSEYNTYAYCLADMGYDPLATSPQGRYYWTGFITANNIIPLHAFAKASGAACNDIASWSNSSFPATKRIGASIAPVNMVFPVFTSEVTEDFFEATASGIISKDYTNMMFETDMWKINEKKQLKHFRRGY